MSKWVRSAFDEREHAVAPEASPSPDVVIAEFDADHEEVADTGPIPSMIEALEALCGARLTVSNGRHTGDAPRCERCEIVVAARATLSDLPIFAEETGRGWFGRMFNRSAAEAR